MVHSLLQYRRKWVLWVIVQIGSDGGVIQLHYAWQTTTKWKSGKKWLLWYLIRYMLCQMLASFLFLRKQFEIFLEKERKFLDFIAKIWQNVYNDPSLWFASGKNGQLEQSKKMHGFCRWSMSLYLPCVTSKDTNLFDHRCDCLLSHMVSGIMWTNQTNQFIPISCMREASKQFP